VKEDGKEGEPPEQGSMKVATAEFPPIIEESSDNYAWYTRKVGHGGTLDPLQCGRAQKIGVVEGA
jgi:hypothetical protein